MYRRLTLCFTVIAVATSLRAQAPNPNRAGLQPGTLPARWVPSGPKCMEVPDWQVHEYNSDFLIVRQSGCLDYEKPFLYLIFGQDRALLYDTGSDNFPAADMVRNVVGKWLKRNRRSQIPLIVVHSHDHSDHIFGDAQLQKMQDPAIPITFVPAEVEATKKFYGIKNWPDEIVSLDLGGRLLDVIPIPGHNVVSVALFDRRTGVLLSGDSFYPGRIYVADFLAFVKSTDRLVKFTEGKMVAHILGCHIEQTETPYLDYPMGTIYQPHERALELSRGDLLDLKEGLASLHGKAAKLALPDVTVWPVPSPAADHVMDKFHALLKEQTEQMWDQLKGKQ